MIKVYLSGPISTRVEGVTEEELKERFNSLERWLKRNFGHWQVVNPLKVDACESQDCNGRPRQDYVHSWFCYLKHDLRDMLLCDAICFLPAFQDSPGAMLEADVALRVGISPYYAELTDEGSWRIA